MTTRVGLTHSIAEFVTSADFDAFPGEVVAKAKLHVLDALGIALGAYATGHELTRNLIELAEGFGGSPEATVLGKGSRLGSLDAAMVNSVLCNFLDSSDGHYLGGHINDRLLPIALAASERVNASGKDLLTAVIVGYEVYIHLAQLLFEEIEPADVKLPYFVMLGTLAGVAPAAKVLGLDVDQIAGALGLAASIQIGGAQYVVSGGHEKDLTPGHEARRALLSCYLAERGILGSADIIEGDHGIMKALGAKPRPLDDLGRRFRVLECYIKPYPACRYLHASIEAALELVRDYDVRPQEVDKVVVTTNRSSASRNSTTFHSHVNAIFSHAYQVAAVIASGRVDYPTAWREVVGDPSFKRLLPRIEVQSTPEYDQRYRHKSVEQPPWPAEVEITLRDGRRLRTAVPSPRGDPGNPLSSEEVREKFRRFVQGALPESRVREVLETVDHLEELHSVGELVQRLVVG